MKAARAVTDGFVTVLGDGDLDKPSIWAGNPVEVRFRLYRFASHLTEHGIHAEKILRAAGREPSWSSLPAGIVPAIPRRSRDSPRYHLRS